MKNFKIWSGMTLIFFSGAVIGVIISTFIIRNHVIGFMKGGPPKANRWIIMKITCGLDLSVDQQTQIDVILENNRSEIEKLSDDFQKSTEAFFNSQTIQIRKVLTEEQKKEFDERAAEIHESIRKRIRMHHPGNRPGRHRCLPPSERKDGEESSAKEG